MTACSARRIVVSFFLFLSWIVLAQPQTPKEEDDAVFRQFLDWLKSQPRDIGRMSDPKPRYCAYLASQGIGEAECSRRWDFVIRRAREGTETAAIYFDKTYADPAAEEFKSTPNDFLVACTKALKPALALDIHMGQGRNALYLAEQGWEVSGFDLSEEGVSRARAEADRKGLRIKAVQQTHQEFNFGRSAWDLVVMSYTWIPLDDAALINRIVDSIKPGGLLVFEHFLAKGDGKRPKGDWLPLSKELPSIFQRLKVVKYEETVAVPDWGGKKPANIVRMLARKAAE